MANLSTRDDILTALAESERTASGFFGGLAPGEFIARSGERWSPAEHLEHLNTSVAAVAKGFAAPRLILRLRFGRTRVPGRSYEALVEDYRARLAAGGKAPGAFIPQVGLVTPAEAETRRAAILARWHRVNARLRDAVAGWSEASLDTIQLPHPLLGTISAREMLYFTIYHAGHHVKGAGHRTV